nr:hypothetical protein [uncultured Mucilaginibacter sp.]
MEVLKMDLKIVAIIGFLGVNFIMLQSKGHGWVRSKPTLIVALLLMITGVSLLTFYTTSDVNLQLAFWAPITPAIFLFLDYCFAKLTFKIHDRDYSLWLRGSSDLRGKSIKASDKIISMVLLYTVIGLPFLPVIFLHH